MQCSNIDSTEQFVTPFGCQQSCRARGKSNSPSQESCRARGMFVLESLRRLRSRTRFGLTFNCNCRTLLLKALLCQVKTQHKDLVCACYSLAVLEQEGNFRMPVDICVASEWLRACILEYETKEPVPLLRPESGMEEGDPVALFTGVCVPAQQCCLRIATCN